MIPEQERLTRKAGDIRSIIESEVGNSTMDLINELIELEIQIEKESNI